VSAAFRTDVSPASLVDLDLDRTAILLDVDGTLIEIAATPMAVRVPPSLKHTLARLRDRLGGALSLVSGRPIEQLDLLFNPTRLPIVGGHGAELRQSSGGEVLQRAQGISEDMRCALSEIAAATPGIIAEEKSHSLALHYRLVPEHERSVLEQIRAVLAVHANEDVEVLPGKSVFEVKPRAFNKGEAIRELMAHAPFAGRRPVFVGDDVTDESALSVLPEFNGIGCSVGRKLRGAQITFATPREVRHWLYDLLVPARAASL
jgi:trehalose 6-phosphate phosphatase